MHTANRAMTPRPQHGSSSAKEEGHDVVHFLFFFNYNCYNNPTTVFSREKKKMSRKQAVLGHCWSIVFKKQDKTFQKMPSEYVN